jgi:DNA-binding NtrC family response regulator
LSTKPRPWSSATSPSPSTGDGRDRWKEGTSPALTDLRRKEPALAQLVGHAPCFLEAIAHISTVAATQAPVLITGETGTGKELVARAIHYVGDRASDPFVAVNCGSLVDTLLEAELFGYERGAFTDAHARKPGLIAQANGGTLFFDEVETLSPRAQVSLLRFLQEGTFRPLGSTSEQRADVRCLAATNAQLERLVQAGTFRSDLYYRLCVFRIALPPLRDRKDDIIPLAEHFIARHSREPMPTLSAGAVRALVAYDWPGNVRELDNAILRAVHTGVSVMEPGHFGLSQPPGALGPLLPEEAGRSYKAEKRRVVDVFARTYLTRLMIEHSGNITQAARAAGKDRSEFGKLLKRYGIEPRRLDQS